MSLTARDNLDCFFAFINFSPNQFPGNSSGHYDWFNHSSLVTIIAVAAMFWQIIYDCFILNRGLSEGAPGSVIFNISRIFTKSGLMNSPVFVNRVVVIDFILYGILSHNYKI